MSKVINMASSAAIRKNEYNENDFSTGENFAELFESSASAALTEGAVVKGTIVAIENDLVVVDVGLKSEGRIPLREFGAAAGKPCDHGTPKIGGSSDPRSRTNRPRSS